MLEWIDDITRFIFLSDKPQKADILFIPGNGHAEPSEYAARLYRQGYAPLHFPVSSPAQKHMKAALKPNGRLCVPC